MLEWVRYRLHQSDVQQLTFHSHHSHHHSMRVTLKKENDHHRPKRMTQRGKPVRVPSSTGSFLFFLYLPFALAPTCTSSANLPGQWSFSYNIHTRTGHVFLQQWRRGKPPSLKQMKPNPPKTCGTVCRRVTCGGRLGWDKSLPIHQPGTNGRVCRMRNLHKCFAESTNALIVGARWYCGFCQHKRTIIINRLLS